MQSLAEGRTKVVAVGHTLVLGRNDATARLVVQIALMRRQYMAGRRRLKTKLSRCAIWFSASIIIESGGDWCLGVRTISRGVFFFIAESRGVTWLPSTALERGVRFLVGRWKPHLGETREILLSERERHIIVALSVETTGGEPDLEGVVHAVDETAAFHAAREFQCTRRSRVLSSSSRPQRLRVWCRALVTRHATGAGLEEARRLFL